MKNLNLNGKWRMKKTTEEKWLNAVVPGSVYSDLSNNGRIEDPYYRDNEKKVLEAFKCDYEYEREFQVNNEFLKCNKILLHCDGIDTMAKILINDKFLANTNNMHRIFEFNVKDLLVEGNNKIKIIFYSPVNYIAKKYNEKRIWGANAMKGFPYIRKGHYMFGWDWGPQVPDMGIWRDIYLIGIKTGRIEDVYIRQQHHDGKVDLKISIQTSQELQENSKLKIKIISPDNKVIEKLENVSGVESNINICVENPQLWWPSGYGNQPLYKVQVILNSEEDFKEYKIGLRKIKIRKEKDKWGESFEFNVNGVSIFAMGADYIPEDNILARCSKEKTRKLIEDCIEANMNCIRVWGGGIYPDNYFYELCDEYGLVVWQDFMFACADYEMSSEFEENIAKEVEDNVKRIRHHACLGIWCGNNENESAIKFWGIEVRKTTFEEYIKQYEKVIPGVVSRFDPDTFYWPSSPSKGGNFENLDKDNMGDNHYWDVWHGLKPFIDFKKYYFRFVSEFGFEAMPDIKTVESYTLKEDRNPFSYVMESHQKCDGGNGKMVYYISEYLKYPWTLENFVYESQIMQAEAIKFGVEHWRRNRGQCMGTIYWQLNDCWPTASWSSIDYYGRWKALHYFAKKFFNPVLISADICEDKAQIYVVNEKRSALNAKVNWKIRDNGRRILNEGSEEIQVSPLTSVLVKTLNINENVDIRRNYLECEVVSDGEVLSSENILFTKPKYFIFLKPQIEFSILEKDKYFIINIKSENFVKYVCLNLRDTDCRFSDNYFDISGEEIKSIILNKDTLSNKISVNMLKSELCIKSIYDIR
ncbi:glycoside hydrolase [Clostridium sp. DMHC 10]|uniref:beta-mannosidase n=1 Tax=Clostridium sp. DMHC 10 TaxID=747377 RepID=UPI00069FEF24|nr:glycoside hydrolase family 2 protein [Clostridium sp. DMHC 10]KOF57508.1 glycoside hydrolase [Clostridium sp. DMHC 10]